jgi:2-polyprenyl-3-methyl-5-hydroxy-6-metoxy-1,4-benzoquinol methylase
MNIYNKILDNQQRVFYKNTINELYKMCPVTIKNKVIEANVQQAFVLDTVRSFSTKNDKLLCVGAYEDTAAEVLKKTGYNIIEIDPLDSIWKPANCEHIIKTNLNDFYEKNKDHLKFKVIFSTSVIEHVENDELFIYQICNLLETGGYGVLTCDFNNSYKKGDQKPSVDYRLYTELDFTQRLYNIIINNKCEILKPCDWSSSPDFNNGEAIYSFASFVFKKN